VPGARYRFMNHGASLGAARDRRAARRLDREDRDDLYYVQLLRITLAGKSLQNKDVLEVGCGRGGNCRYVAKYLAPRHVTGLDLSRGNVRFCRRAHADLCNLVFRSGSAQALPFGAASFDAVLNIESSHCYPDPPGFFAEVHRVLRAGGRLHYADCFSNASGISRASRWLKTAGFVTELHQDITAEVARGIAANADIFARTLLDACRNDRGRLVAWNLIYGINHQLERDYRTRRALYAAWVARKP
jgi:O-methyltransferase